MKYIKDLKISTVAFGSEDYPGHSGASLIECKDGSLKIAWQRCEKSKYGSDDAAPTNIVMMDCKSGNPEDGWVSTRIVASPTLDCVNVYSPDFIRLKDGSLMLMYAKYNQLMYAKPRISTGYYKISHDDGATFGEEHILWERKNWRNCNDGTRRLKSGRLITPLEAFSGSWLAADDHCYISVMYSDDDGKTWEFSPNEINLPMRGAMEPCIAECPDGSLIMVIRSQLGSVMRSYSYDGGITWTKPQTTGLRSPESCPYIVSIPNSDSLMVLWNNSEYDPQYASHYGKRTPFTLAFSDDAGKTFYNFTDIETDPTRAFTNPSVTWTRDGRCLITYGTDKYLPSGKMSGGLADLKLASFVVESK